MQLGSFLPFCLLGIYSGVYSNQVQQIEVKETWDNRFHAVLSFTTTEDVNGWEVKINFSSPVSSINQWFGDVIYQNADKTELTLANLPHNGIVSSGGTIKIEMYVDYSGTTPPVGTGELINLGTDSYTPEPAPADNDGTKYDYNRVLELSILFYEAQRSGKLPPNNRIPWRDDSALNDSGGNGEDLTGGWYDAGDHIKFNFPMAFTVTSLAWGLLEFKDAYEAAGQLDYMYDCIQWPLDYLMKCHVAPHVFYGQVGNGGLDHAYWGRPENMTMNRPSYKIDEQNPGRDLAGEAAAAMAASYLVFHTKNPSYAGKLLRHAKELFDFAEKFPGKYSDSINDAAAYYRSNDDQDELCWAGVWLYLATKEPRYLQVAEANYIPGAAWGQSWDEKNAGCMVLLYKVTQKQAYLDDIEATFQDWMPGGSIDYTPKGLAWRIQWGSNRYSANMAFVAIMASLQGIHSKDYQKWAESQINYILGDGGRSYLVGFGTDFPTQPHHRGSSCPSYPAPCASFQMSQDGPNPHILYGAMVGGPGQNDDYTDKRTDYIHNEVACDYNAGFQSAVAGLKFLYMTGALP